MIENSCWITDGQTIWTADNLLSYLLMGLNKDNVPYDEALLVAHLVRASLGEHFTKEQVGVIELAFRLGIEYSDFIRSTHAVFDRADAISNETITSN